MCYFVIHPTTCATPTALITVMSKEAGALCYAYLEKFATITTNQGNICITWILVIYILNIVSVPISKFHTTTIRETMFE